MKIILASKSPRRKEILEHLGVSFDVMSADDDENSDLTDPAQLTQELARRKAGKILSDLRDSGTLTEDTAIIAADTVVYSGGIILGKPKDRKEAQNMLVRLSGKPHTVFTGVAVADFCGCDSDVSATEVYFDEIPELLLEAYLDTPEPYDKAGAYGIQGYAARWIRKINGCYFGVMGLPVNVLESLFFKKFGSNL